MCNATLQRYGGDIYVGIMTVINSVREIVTMPVTGLTAASQPVIGYNYGAGCYQRVKSAIRFTAVGCIVFTTVVWAVLFWRVEESPSSLSETSSPRLQISPGRSPLQEAAMKKKRQRR